MDMRWTETVSRPHTSLNTCYMRYVQLDISFRDSPNLILNLVLMPFFKNWYMRRVIDNALHEN